MPQEHKTNDRLSPAVLVILALGFSFACSDTGLDPSTGMDVHVRRGPVDSVTADSSDGTVAVDSAGIVVFNFAGNALGQAFTDTAGVARFAFPPGAYRVQVSSCPGAAKVPDPVTTQVVSGAFSLVTFLCDTGSEPQGVAPPR